MLDFLRLVNVGPSSEMELHLGRRLNVITGDNGLGKSFLLDAVWFAHTGTWPAEANSKASAGFPAIPSNGRKGRIEWMESSLAGAEAKTKHSAFHDFDRRWLYDATNFSPESSLVIYLMADSTVAIFDPLKYHPVPPTQVVSHRKSMVLDFSQVWNGYMDEEGRWLCNGLIRDWATWQGENSAPFAALVKLLDRLSPDSSARLKPGNLSRISIEDTRRMPTILMPYEGEVAVIHASSAIRRMLTLAYMIVWALDEHGSIAQLRRVDKAKSIVILLDEIESHLHPTWQRTILPALLGLGKSLEGGPSVQYLLSTHSPLVMASMEPHFDAAEDAWFDLDLETDGGEHPTAVLRKRRFEKMGGVENWLLSEAFDQESTGSIEAQEAMKLAGKALLDPGFSENAARRLHADLRRVLAADDLFWTRWRMVTSKRGWNL